MRSTHYSRGSSHSQNTIPWRWIGIIAAIVSILFLVRIFGSSESEGTEAYLNVTPGDESSVYISMTNASKTRITEEQRLLATDKSVSVEEGNAIAKNEFMKIDIDKGSELSYRYSSSTGNVLGVTKGRAWISDITQPLIVELKNYNVRITPGTTVMVEQNARYSYAYAIDAPVTIITSLGEQELGTGNMIQLNKSDLTNPNTKITDWIKPIDGTVSELPLFSRNNGLSLLKQSISVGSGTTSGSGSTESQQLTTTSKYIEVTEPKEGTLLSKGTLTVMGNILSRDVKRVTINNVDATVSPVDETFVLQNIPVSSEIFDIVYKAYDSNNSLLQTGVLTVFGSKSTIQSNSTSLVPETFPLSTKDFKIVSPNSNPYSTTDKLVVVEGVIPTNTVDYIVVNDFRLKQFQPKSGKWYYYANTAYGSMSEGLNLYNIKFYKADGTLLFTQALTIIKESKNATVSGE